MNPLEEKIVQEVIFILSSQQLQTLCNCLQQGIPHTEIINDRIIQVEPQAPFSGMTLFAENGFVLGKEAFISKEELIKTLLHEIYRLETSAIRKTGNATQEIVTGETKAASEFVDKAIASFFSTIRQEGC